MVALSLCSSLKRLLFNSVRNGGREVREPWGYNSKYKLFLLSRSVLKKGPTVARNHMTLVLVNHIGKICAMMEFIHNNCLFAQPDSLKQRKTH